MKIRAFKGLLAQSFMLPLLMAQPVPAQYPAHGTHGHGMHTAPDRSMMRAESDGRQLVNFPEPMRQHTLASMREHLQTLGEIQQALAEGQFDRASELAEQRLGMSSLPSHQAHEVARFMPPGMRQAGTDMHRAASQFAVVAKDASVTGDLKAVLRSLAKVNHSCVACHAAYRLN